MDTRVSTAICSEILADHSSVGINGNIIANPGFVRQFGTELNAAGDLILSASVLSAIGTIQSVGQIIGMTTLPL
jgi:hypothetical protein